MKYQITETLAVYSLIHTTKTYMILSYNLQVCCKTIQLVSFDPSYNQLFKQTYGDGFHESK